MYCDNYWPMLFDRMWERYRDVGAPALIDRLQQQGRLLARQRGSTPTAWCRVFDRSRTTPGSAASRSATPFFDAICSICCPRRRLLIEKRSTRAGARAPAGGVCHRSPLLQRGLADRLPLTERFSAGTPTVILDRDGVLNQRPPQAEYVRTWREFEWLPGSLEALRLVPRGGLPGDRGVEPGGRRTGP